MECIWLDANMATGSSRLTGTAAVTLSLKRTGSPSDYHKRHGTWAPWRYYSNIRIKKLSRIIILALYMFFLLGTQMWGWGSWRSARMHAALLVNSPGKPTVSLPLDSWSQYIIFSKVLYDGRAWSVQHEQHRHSTILVSIKRDRAIIFCVILLPGGDVRLDPRPITLEICKSAFHELPKPAVASTCTGSRGNTPTNTLSVCSIGQMLKTPVLSRTIPTNPT